MEDENISCVVGKNKKKIEERERERERERESGLCSGEKNSWSLVNKS